VDDRCIEQAAGTVANLALDDPDGALSRLVFAALDGPVLQHSVHRSAEAAAAALDRPRDVLRRLLEG
jgi:hypothetical protein